MKFEQKVLIEEPPRFEEIDAIFNVRGRPVIFSYGVYVYNPTGFAIPNELMAHEKVHGLKQLLLPENVEQEEIQQNKTLIEEWWEFYLKDPEFRFKEELPAHQREYKYYKEHCKDREKVAKYLSLVSGRLSGPTYGGLISFTKARSLILGVKQ